MANSIMSVNKIKESRLHPLWVTGFSDAEASFGLDFVKKPSSRTG
jgi:hypothetical protein